MCLTIPAKVLEVRDGRALVTSRTGTREVVTTHVPVDAGDYVLVQGGVVMARLDPRDAREMLEAWDEVEGPAGA